MPCWYFEKDDLLHSPSKGDGIDFQTEARYREEGAGFIIEVANKLGIQYDTYASAIVYFHRFYMLQSFRNFHRHVMATSCLLLSNKIQNSVLTLKDLLGTIESLLSSKQFGVFGQNPQLEVIQAEMSLLETLKFDLDVIHPYAYVLHYTKLLQGDKETIQQLLHMSWTFVNDSLYTTLCVQYEPDLLAVAFLYLACRLTKFDVTTWHGKPSDYRGKWYEHFVSDMNLEILKDICHQVLGLYSKTPNKENLISEPGFRATRSPSPVRSRHRSSSRERSRRRSASSSPRRRRHASPGESSRRYDREVSPRRSRNSRSRTRSHSRRRRHSRSPERSRRSKSLQRTKSPSPKKFPTDLGAYFLTREGFEELQAKMRAGQLPSEPVGVNVPPPQPAPFGTFSEAMPPFVPGFQPLSFRQPPPQVVVAFPYAPPPQLPPASGVQFPPNPRFPGAPPEFPHNPQVVVHHPPVIPHHVVEMHPMPGQPHPPRPEMHGYGQPPGPFPDVRHPFPPNFEGPRPPGVSDFMPFPQSHLHPPPAGFPGPAGIHPHHPEGQIQRSPEVGGRQFNVAVNASQRRPNLIYPS